MDSPVYQRNLKDEKIFRMASESAEEEFKTFELPILIKEFEKSKKSVFLTEHGFHKKNDISHILILPQKTTQYL